MKVEWGAVLEKTHFKTVKHLKNLTEGHILYIFENLEKYIKNVVDFVMCGLEQNQYSLIIENDRINLMLKKHLAPMLSKDQLNKVMIINNYDFYYVKGDFQCNSIFEYLPKLIEGYSEEGFSVLSWAHVEWGDEAEVHKKLSNSEKEACIIVNDKKLLSVCAYDSDRVNEALKGSLINHHNFLLNDQEKSMSEANQKRIQQLLDRRAIREEYYKTLAKKWH
ncbi:MEDS domain-containing protein [Bacillus sp. FJAT-27251]|uniref:MEDS domain-containing protein n=1 Tax=Bacillus sp. FJAT-27251 TaxID=1684142 RepID=UPI001E540864|nr:MEDS domain-containing protein [Bacillus sp. FJAT-27251]